MDERIDVEVSDVHPEDSEERKIFRRYTRAVEESEKACTRVHKRAKKNWDYASSLSSQWEEEDIERQKDMGRPALSLDKIGPTMRMITGQEMLERFRPRIVSKLYGAIPEGFAEAADDLVSWQREQSSTANEESEAFSWTYVCGYGSMYKYPDRLLEVDGIVPIRDEHVPIYDLLWDCKARQQNLVDRRYHARLKLVDEDEFKEVWLSDQPNDVIEHLKEEEPYSGAETVSWATVRDSKYSSSYGADRGRRRAVVEFEWTEVVSRWITVGPDGSLVTLASMDEVREYRKEFLGLTGEELPEDQIAKKVERIIRYAFISGKAVLEHGERPVFRTRFITGFPAPKDGVYEFFGPVDGQRGPQDLRNRLYSLALTHYAASPKGLLLYERSAVDNPEVFNDLFASPAASIDVKDGFFAEERFRILDPPRNIGPPPELFQFANQAIEEQVGAAGVLAQQDDLRRISGKVASLVKQSAATVMSKPFDSHRRGRAEDAKATIEMAKQLYTQEDIIAILGEEKAGVGPPIEEWPSSRSFVVKVEEISTDTDEMMELLDLLTRTGTIDTLISTGKMSVETFIELMPRIDATIKAKMLSDAAKGDAFGALVQALAQDPQGAQLLQQIDQQFNGAVSAVMKRQQPQAQ